MSRTFLILSEESGRRIFTARVRAGIIRQAGEVIHAGAEGKGNAPALLKRIVAPAALNLGIIALVNPREHLHFDLCNPALLSKLLQSIIHKITN